LIKKNRENLFFDIFSIFFQGAPQPRHHHHHHQSPRQVSGIPSGPYMSVYMPTQTADVILPMHRNGRTTNAYGYMHT